MGSLVEEIFSRRLDKDVEPGQIVVADVDYVMSHDTTTPLAIEAWKKTGKPLFDNNRIVIVFDHHYPAPNITSANTHRNLKEFVKHHNIKHFFTEGVSHQIMVEKGFAQPSNIVVGGDSHTCTYGALGCFSTGMGSTDIGVVWATGKNWFKIPETINVKVEGRFPHGVYAKDLILETIKRLGAAGATYKSLEFTGQTIKEMEIHERLTVCNMAIEAGAKCGLIAPNSKTRTYLEDKTNQKVENISAKDPEYTRTVSIDVTQLNPQIAYPNRVDNVKPISEFEGLKLDQVFIGTCTNGRYEDLKKATQILNGKKVHEDCKTIVVPASNAIYKKAIETGVVKDFVNAGAIVGNPGCGPCVGRYQGVLAKGERALTTMNRNFTGRMGSPQAEIYLSSPATAAASAISGEITDPREVL